MTLLIELLAKAFNFTKSITPPWVFFTFFLLYKRHQISQSVSFVLLFLASSQKVKAKNQEKVAKK